MNSDQLPIKVRHGDQYRRNLLDRIGRLSDDARRRKCRRRGFFSGTIVTFVTILEWTPPENY